MTQSFDWIELGGFVGREDTGNDADDDAGQDAQQCVDRSHVQDGCPEDALDDYVPDCGKQGGDGDTEQAAEQADQEGFRDEDAADIFVASADRFDDADFLCPLNDADVEDGQDHDGRYEQGNASHTG